MVECRRGLGLANEAADALFVTLEIGREDLQGDPALELDVASEKDLAHTSCTELGDYYVMRKVGILSEGGHLRARLTQVSAGLSSLSSPARHEFATEHTEEDIR